MTLYQSCPLERRREIAYHATLTHVNLRTCHALTRAVPEKSDGESWIRGSHRPIVHRKPQNRSFVYLAISL